MGGTGGAGGIGGTKRYIIFHSDLSSDFSQLSFTSEDFLGSRSSRSRSSRASSNISSRLWDFSPRESEWDGDVSQGSRDSQLSKQDWAGGPSLGLKSELSLLSPIMPRKGSVVTFDMGNITGEQGGLRRHSSPAPSLDRRRSCSAALGGGDGRLAASAAQRYKDSTFGGMGVGGVMPLRHVEEYRTLNQYRKRSAGDQSIISVRIDENDGDEDEQEEDVEGEGEERGDDENDDDHDERTPLSGSGDAGCDTTVASRPGCSDASVGDDCAVEAAEDEEEDEEEEEEATDEVTEIMILAMRQASLERRVKDTSSSTVERRVAQILQEIEYGTATDDSTGCASDVITAQTTERGCSPRQAVTDSADDCGGVVSCLPALRRDSERMWESEEPRAASGVTRTRPGYSAVPATAAAAAAGESLFRPSAEPLCDSPSAKFFRLGRKTRSADDQTSPGAGVSRCGEEDVRTPRTLTSVASVSSGRYQTISRTFDSGSVGTTSATRESSCSVVAPVAGSSGRMQHSEGDFEDKPGTERRRLDKFLGYLSRAWILTSATGSQNVRGDSK